MKGVEGSFLKSWKAWDECDTFSLQFYEPVYKRGVGIPDDVIEQAGDDSCFYVSCDTGKIAIYDRNGDEIFDANVKLVIV